MISSSARAEKAPTSRGRRRSPTGVSAEDARKFGLPCGGTIQLVVEPLNHRESHISDLLEAVENGKLVARTLDLETASVALARCPRNDALSFDGQTLTTVHGPRYRMLIIGAGQLSKYLAQIAIGLDYQGDGLRSARGIHGDVGRARHHAREDDARRHRDRDAPRRALRGGGADARPEARRSLH